jgi:hypothetical protein
MHVRAPPSGGHNRRDEKVIKVMTWDVHIGGAM